MLEDRKLLIRKEIRLLNRELCNTNLNRRSNPPVGRVLYSPDSYQEYLLSERSRLLSELNSLSVV
jgi:hypothetical protein